MSPLLGFTEEVEDAIAERTPLVALESTLLAHGLPVDQRLKVAQTLEAIVREAGAVPATVALIDGRWQVGLTEDMLLRVTNDAQKASLAHMAVAVVTGEVFATTVAATMAVAARAGIRVFATGGIGGVHRGAAESFDESADLTALSRFPVAVVSAGAKAVLDLPKTMERLETLGVPVIGYQTNEFPAFYHAKSELSVTHRVDTPEAVAKIMAVQFDQIGQGGLLVAQPPPEATRQAPAHIDQLIQTALETAKTDGITGQNVTPFLLATLDRLSGGDVVRTNVDLVAHNTRLAARIAVADRRLAGNDSPIPPPKRNSNTD